MPDQNEPDSQLQKAQDAIDDARAAAADALPQDELPAPNPDAETSENVTDPDADTDPATEADEDDSKADVEDDSSTGDDPAS